MCSQHRPAEYINWLSTSLQVIVALQIPPEISNLNALRAIFLKSDYPEIYPRLLNSKAALTLDANYPRKLTEVLLSISIDEVLAFEAFLKNMPILNLGRRRL